MTCFVVCVIDSLLLFTVWDIVKEDGRYNRHRGKQEVPQEVVDIMAELFQGNDEKFFRKFDKDSFDLLFEDKDAVETDKLGAIVLLVVFMRRHFYRDSQGMMHVLEFGRG